MTIWIPNLEEMHGPVYRQIANAIHHAIEDGTLKPGDRLPTHRDLAYHLGVTVGTITRAYREAERLDLVAGEVGRGTYVLDAPETLNIPVAERKMAAAFSYQIEQKQSSPTSNEIGANAGAINFRMNCPVPPVESHVRDVLRELSTSLPLEDLVSYKSEYSEPVHRKIISDFFVRKGLESTPDRVLPIAGVQHGMTVALLSLVRPGDLVLCEELTYPNLKSLAKLLQFRLRGVTMDQEGIVPEALDTICRTQSPRAIYLMPTMHNPLCSTLGLERRKEIAAILRKYEIFLIEDGIYSFLDENAPPPLSSFAPERSIYLNGVSKSVGGGLRIGYLDCPPEIIGRVASAIRTTCWMVSSINIELVSRLIDDGTVERYEAWHRTEAARRLAVILEMLKDYDVRYSPTNYHIWLTLPDQVDIAELVVNAANNNLLLTGAQQFAVGTPPHAIRLSFGAERNLDRIRQGIRTLLCLLQGCTFGNSPVI